MHTTLAALAVVAVGYIFAYLVFDRLRVRFGYAGAAEYILLGILLGPRVAGLVTESAVRDLTPIVSLAIGWLGMSLGMYFRLPTLALEDPAHVRIAFAEPLATLAGAFGLLYLLLHFAAGFPVGQSVILAAALAAIATVSAPAAIDAFAANRRRSTHPLFPVLQVTARVDGLVGVVAFGLLAAIVHQGAVAPSVRPPTATEWAVINLAVGVATGVLFHLFLGPRPENGGRDDGGEAESRLFVAVAAAIVIASGVSYYLNLSPIYTNLILGFILTNTGRAHPDVRQFLARTERPVYLALLVFAGAAWHLPLSTVLYLVPAFVGVRLVARLVGGWVAGTAAAPPALRAPRMGRALLAQGGIGVALALSYAQIFRNLYPEVVLSAALLSVLLFEIAAAAETAAFLRGRTPARRREPVSAAGADTGVEA